MNSAVNGNGTYTWNVKNFAYGGYHVTMNILKNDGSYTRYNDKYFCVGTGTNPPTNTPQPSQPTATNQPVHPTETPVPLPTVAQ